MDRSIHLIGLNHRSADVAVRECFALPDAACADGWSIVPDGDISESLVLSTCNRVEILLVGRGEEVWRKALFLWAARCGKPADALLPHLYRHADAAAVEHLFSVAAGLDSLVLGEPQILGQLKDAYRRAVAEKTAKVILNRLLHKAFMTAKRVRSETAVSSSAVSVSYAAVSLAKRIFGELRNRTALVVGAGEMAELAAVHLAEGQGARIAVTNRTHERAVALASRFGGRALPFAHLEDHLAEADIVITSTGATEPVIRCETMRVVMRRRRHRPVFLIDIAVPRDVEHTVNTLDNVYLYNIDDLAEVAEAGRAARRDEAVRAAAIVREETERFCAWMRSLGLHATIADLMRRSESIAREELDKTLRRIGPVDADTEAALCQMLAAVIKKLHHDPITYLKRRFDEEDAGMRSLDLARRLFNLNDDAVPAGAHAGRRGGRGNGGQE